MIHGINSSSVFFTQSLNGVYAHGELEKFLGTDIVITSGLETYVKYNQVSKRFMPYSIHQTFAINRKGEVRKVRCYLWYGKQTHLIRGLVVLVDDEPGNLYAENLCRLGADSL